MSIADAVTTYGRAWNERDRDARVRLLEEALSVDARYTDSEFDAVGIEAVADVIGEYHRRHQGFRIRGTSGVDGHHDVIRFTWEFEAKQDGETVVVDGADTILLSEDARLQRILVFDGAQPPPTGG